MHYYYFSLFQKPSIVVPGYIPWSRDTDVACIYVRTTGVHVLYYPGYYITLGQEDVILVPGYSVVGHEREYRMMLKCISYFELGGLCDKEERGKREGGKEGGRKRGSKRGRGEDEHVCSTASRLC